MIAMSPKTSKKQVETLRALRAQLQEDLERIEKDVDLTQQELAEEANHDDRIAEIAALALGRELGMSLEENVRLLLDRVDAALAAVEAGKYGVCTSCGKPIPRERLDAVPYAERCIDCQRREEKR